VHEIAIQRLYSNRTADTPAVLQILRSNVYRFGDPNFAAPVFRDVEWTISEGESWAVVGTGSKEKSALLQVRNVSAPRCLHCELELHLRHSLVTYA